MVDNEKSTAENSRVSLGKVTPRVRRDLQSLSHAVYSITLRMTRNLLTKI